MRAHRIIASCDTTPVFEISEHAFDFVAMFVKRFIVGNIDSAVLPGGLDSLTARGFAKPIGVMAAIRWKKRRGRQSLDQRSGSFVIAYPSFGQNFKQNFEEIF